MGTPETLDEMLFERTSCHQRRVEENTDLCLYHGVDLRLSLGRTKHRDLVGQSLHRALLSGLHPRCRVEVEARLRPMLY